ncbi:MAG: flagellar basal body-associated FliL family protein [Oceanicaulis sp.]
MAEDVEDAPEDGAENEAGEAKKGGLKKLILFVGLPVVILLLAGVAGALLLLGGGDEAEQVAEGEHGEGHAETAEAAPSASNFFENARHREFSMTVNITDSEGRTLSMVLEFAVVFTEEQVGALLDNEQVQLRLTATINEFLRTLRVEDLDGSMGNFRVKAEMLRRTNLVIAPQSADDVLILNMVMG